MAASTANEVPRTDAARHAADRHHRRRAWRSPSSSAPSRTACACRRWSATCWPASRSGPSRRASSPTRRWRSELAEIGVILLMFGVGLHFSLKDLWSVRADRRAGRHRADRGRDAARHRAGAMRSAGPIGAGLVFGLALSVASTVVLLRALQERRLVETERGRIAVGWLIVEDLAMVLALVLLPALAPLLGGEPAGRARRLAASSAGGRSRTHAWRSPSARSPPSSPSCWSSAAASSRGSCTASPTPARASCSASPCWRSRSASPSARRKLFGVSFALGAFFAGMILGEVRAQPAGGRGDAAAARRLRGAVLRLGRHAVRSGDPGPRAAGRCWRRCSSSSFGKSLAALAIVLAFGYPLGTALTISASLAQIGEFSFILAGARRRARPAAGARARPDPRRRHHLDPAQPAAVHGARPAEAVARRA